MQIRRVLCPVEYSEFSRRALHHAAAIAEWYDAELHVLHAFMELAPVSVPLLVPAPPNMDVRASVTVALHHFVMKADLTGRRPKWSATAIPCRSSSTARATSPRI